MVKNNKALLFGFHRKMPLFLFLAHPYFFPQAGEVTATISLNSPMAATATVGSSKGSSKSTSTTSLHKALSLPAADAPDGMPTTSVRESTSGVICCIRNSKHILSSISEASPEGDV